MSTLTATNPYRLAAGEGIAEVWWKTGRLTVKTGVAADASFAQLEVRDPRGTATPLHIHHDQDEAFYVLQGEVVVFVEDDRIHLGPGDFAFVPRGAVHAYLVTSTQARMLVTLSPAGLEELFVAAGIPVTSAGPPPEEVLPPIAEMVARFAEYGCEIVGPPPSLGDQ
jgi:quercetin dioxygenase-like cupin family protein